MTLVDTNVLSDLWSGGVWREWSRRRLEAAAAEGVLLINDAVFAELSAGFDDVGSTEAYVARLGLEIARTPRPALFAAAQAHRRYRKADGAQPTVPPDFFIGAHAQALGCPLLTRDVRRYRTYFPDVRLITP